MGVPLNRSAAVSDDEVESVELDLFLEGVYRCYGYDFRGYARASLRRRLTAMMRSEKVETLSALQDRVLHDRAAWERCLQGISVNVSAMFRDPAFFLAFRRPVLDDQVFRRIVESVAPQGS